MTTPDPFEHTGAAYVFGALDAAETAEFEAHLVTCAACTARVAEARGLTSLLSDITVAEIEAQVPETLLPGLLRKASASRRRQSWLVGGLAAVAAACLVTLAVLVWPATSNHADKTIAMTPVVASPVRATLELKQTSSGTQIKLHCTYAGGSGAAKGVWYALVVVDKQNGKQSLSTWTLSPGEDKNFPATTALSENQISGFQVTYEGHAILTASL